MDWNILNDINQLEEIKQKSFEKPQVIFKHSTRCPISSMILNRIEREETVPNIDFYYLDLIKYRNISDTVETLFNIEHESPQILLIQGGKCTYNESHYGIMIAEITDRI